MPGPGKKRSHPTRGSRRKQGKPSLAGPFGAVALVIVGLLAAAAFHGPMLAGIYSGRVHEPSGTAASMSSLKYSLTGAMWTAQDFLLTDSENPDTKILEISRLRLTPHRKGTEDGRFRYESITADDVQIHLTSKTLALLRDIRKSMPADDPEGGPDPVSFKKAVFHIKSISMDIPLPGMGARNLMSDRKSVMLEDVHSMESLLLRLVEKAVTGLETGTNFLYSL